ncbi:MAG: homoserine O-acetyltransferase [Crocinitomicaceae bacterium]|nr:homoserine O-acetyltransferase [Crocinitomicaceae bacterium]NGF75502.1 homoserine O-acetyltransferase [Fluviicola sp. SGL-29]
MHSYTTNTPFHLENGGVLEHFSMTYHTYGKLNKTKTNVVWVCHALTANSDAQDWWSGIVGTGKLYDPNDYFIVCANTIGSHYGTTGPLTAQLNQRPLLDKFPGVTIRDMINAHVLLRKHLGIQSINTLIGASIGGQQAVEWAITEPQLIEQLILIATNARHSAYGIAFNESQRMAIYTDPTYGNGNIKGGVKGLIAARSIALLSYRSYSGYAANQTDSDNERTDDFLASSYQRYQGEKLAKRFNAYSYVLLSKAMDTHNVGRGRKSVEHALARIQAKTLVIGIESDVLFPVSEQQFLAEHIQNARYEQIKSDFGHDGFLLEYEQLTHCIRAFYEDKLPDSLPGLSAINYN